MMMLALQSSPLTYLLQLSLLFAVTAVVEVAGVTVVRSGCCCCDYQHSKLLYVDHKYINIIVIDDGVGGIRRVDDAVDVVDVVVVDAIVVVAAAAAAVARRPDE
jgi:hypothetical protein